MHIGVISSPHIPVPPLKYGGVERVIYYLIKGLQEAGHEVTLFATGDSKVNCELVPIVDKHLFFGADNDEQQRILERAEAVAVHTNELIANRIEEFDIIHSHGFDLLQFEDFPNITTLHGMFTLDDMEYYERRRNLHYVSISKNQQKPLPDLDYVGVAYNGLDPSVFPTVIEPQDYACFIGRFDREKNPHLAIELALELDIPIKLAGKIDFLGSEYFDQEIKPHLNNPRVEYLGEVGIDDKIELISNAAVNFHPTNFREPFGLTIIESAYCGTPTVAIDRGSMSELIEDGRTGILVEDFIEAYHHLEKGIEFDRAYVSQRARMLFNYQSMTEQYLQAYNDVIARYA